MAGLVLLTAGGLAFLVLMASEGYLGKPWQDWIAALLERVAAELALTGEQAQFVTWLGGILTAVGGASLTLLASWHFAEMNLPQRLKDLAEANDREHLSDRPGLLAVAQAGLGGIPEDIERSRITFLRRLVGWWSPLQEAKLLAASVQLISKEAAALAASAREAQQRQITAHLILAYDLENAGEVERAVQQAEFAVGLREDDIEALDHAAGIARRAKLHDREMHWLTRLLAAAQVAENRLAAAQALRRQAELLLKLGDDQNLKKARDNLQAARTLLAPMAVESELKLELGRALTLLCEVQCTRQVFRSLSSPNGAWTQADKLLSQTDDMPRPTELGGEIYGKARVQRVREQIDLLMAEPDDDVGDYDQ